MQRVAKAAEIANAIVFLASDLASFTTGAIQVGDGGVMGKRGGGGGRGRTGGAGGRWGGGGEGGGRGAAMDDEGRRRALDEAVRRFGEAWAAGDGAALEALLS